jgi:hypothetical protein
MVGVPVLTPRLSSYWIALVTRVGLPLAQELVEGVRHDLDPSGPRVWDELPRDLTPLDLAMRRALDDEPLNEVPSAATWARLEAIGRALA